MLENLSKLGGNYMSSAQKRINDLSSICFNKDIDRMVGMIGQTIRYPIFSDQEFQEALQTAEYEVAELAYKSDLYLPEELHTVAYKENTLGLPLFIPQERIPWYLNQTLLIIIISFSNHKTLSLPWLVFLMNMH